MGPLLYFDVAGIVAWVRERVVTIGEALRTSSGRPTMSVRLTSCPCCAGKATGCMVEAYTCGMESKQFDNDLRFEFQSKVCMHNPSQPAASCNLRTYLRKPFHPYSYIEIIRLASQLRHIRRLHELRSLLFLSIITNFTLIAACTSLFSDFIKTESHSAISWHDW